MRNTICELERPSETAIDSTGNRRIRKEPGVLVVDDERLMRIMVKLGLKRHGFEVFLASDGEDAIKTYRAHQGEIDVALLDVEMPGLDGPETFERLRHLNSGVPVCFMSGDPGVWGANKVAQEPGVHFVAKPFHLDDIANILRLLAQGVPLESRPADRERQVSQFRCNAESIIQKSPAAHEF